MASDYMSFPLDALQSNNLYASARTSSTPTKEELESWGYTVTDSDDAFGLDFTDFLQLMVQQLQNQTIDSAADTSDMLNQMVQMSVVQMMSQVQTSLDNLTSASTMTYAASLVGKTVTVGVYNEEGKIEELVGTVDGTGTYQNTPVIFVGGEMYPLSSIMAVGTLPPVEGGEESGDATEGGETVEGSGSAEGSQTTEGSETVAGGESVENGETAQGEAPVEGSESAENGETATESDAEETI